MLQTTTCLDHVFLLGYLNRGSELFSSYRVIPVSFLDHSAILVDIQGVSKSHLVGSCTAKKIEIVNKKHFTEELDQL